MHNGLSLLMQYAPFVATHLMDYGQLPIASLPYTYAIDAAKPAYPLYPFSSAGYQTVWIRPQSLMACHLRLDSAITVTYIHCIHMLRKGIEDYSLHTPMTA